MALLFVAAFTGSELSARLISSALACLLNVFNLK